MESLLRWSIENSTPMDSAPGERPPVRKEVLDPEIIDMILGKPDAVLMKEDMAVAVDPERSEDDRINALDHLEMLIEQIDNANNLENLKLWAPLHALLTSDASPPDVKTQALWVVGTALQNNPSAQNSYLLHNPLATLTSFLTPSPASTSQSRSKAIYTLSGLLKHNAPALRGLGAPEVDGWSKLRDTLQDPEISVRRKTVFLLNTLLTPTATIEPSPSSSSNLHTPDQPSAPIHPNSHASHLQNPSNTSTSELTLDALRSHGITGAIISGLADPLPYGEDGDIVEIDLDFEEKSIRLLHTYLVSCNGELLESEKATLKSWLQKETKQVGESGLAERGGLTLDELRALVAKVV